MSAHLSQVTTSLLARRQQEAARRRRSRLIDRPLSLLGATSLVLLPLAIAVAIAVGTAPANAGARAQYEYRCMKRNIDVTAHLNRLGAQGWKLVASAGAAETADSSLADSSHSVVEDVRSFAAALAKEWKAEGGREDFSQRFSDALAERVATKLTERWSASTRLPSQTPAMVWCLMRQTR